MSNKKPIVYKLDALDDIKILSEDEIHIWLLDIEQENVCVSLNELYSILNIEEKERLARYKFDDHKKRFLYSRGILKLLLSNYLGTKAKDVLITYNDRGKPLIGVNVNVDNINFNLSHSQELITFAFTLGNSIGVDMEYIDKTRNITSIAKKFFSQRECNYLNRFTDHLQCKLFYIFWTFKEALLKCIGTGLVADFKNISIPILEQENFELEKDMKGVWECFGKLWQYNVLEVRNEYIINVVCG
jgi:4'-phosphopantetheinyl transferase